MKRYFDFYNLSHDWNWIEHFYNFFLCNASSPPLGDVYLGTTDYRPIYIEKKQKICACVLCDILRVY